MANAKVITEEKSVTVKKTVPTGITLQLSCVEALAIAALCGRVNGQGGPTTRVYEQINGVFNVNHLDHRISVTDREGNYIGGLKVGNFPTEEAAAEGVKY